VRRSGEGFVRRSGELFLRPDAQKSHFFFLLLFPTTAHKTLHTCPTNFYTLAPPIGGASA